MLSSADEGDGPAELTLSVAATSVISMPQELLRRTRSTAVLRCEEACARIDIAKIKRSKKMTKNDEVYGRKNGDCRLDTL